MANEWGFGMNIVLIGYRGTGKSSVGKIVSERLAMNLIVMDSRIVELEGMSIPDIVAKYGWDYFRDREARVAQEISEKDNCVVDTGGGVILRPDNIRYLKKNGTVFWLKASAEIIAERIRESTERPSLTGSKTFLEEIREVLAERLPKYESSADYEIDTDTLAPPEVADRIVEIMGKRGPGV